MNSRSKQAHKRAGNSISQRSTTGEVLVRKGGNSGGAFLHEHVSFMIPEFQDFCCFPEYQRYI